MIIDLKKIKTDLIIYERFSCIDEFIEEYADFFFDELGIKITGDEDYPEMFKLLNLFLAAKSTAEKRFFYIDYEFEDYFEIFYIVLSIDEVRE